jgi:hypothetical protein
MRVLDERREALVEREIDLCPGVGPKTHGTGNPL